MAEVSGVYRPVFERASEIEFVRVCESCVKYAVELLVGGRGARAV
jgi:hypothetical protein